MKPTYALAIVLALTGGMAQAQLTSDAVVADLIAQGYKRIELKSGLSRIKAEATRGTERREIVYDRTTGAILKQEAVSLVAGAQDAVAGSERRDDRRLATRGERDDDPRASDDGADHEDGHVRGRDDEDDRENDDRRGGSDDSSSGGADDGPGGNSGRDDHGGDSGSDQGDDHSGDHGDDD